ncbi:hypothetical protein ADMFC3_23390 [Geovibrio sp. ADMFC3]
MNFEDFNFDSYLTDRATLYAFMSGLFSECLRYDVIQVIPHILKGFEGISKNIEHKKALIESAENVDKWLVGKLSQKDSEELCLELAREHTSYFVLGRFNIPDNASATLSIKKLIKRDEWKNCKKFYHQHGYILKKNSGKLEDSFEVQCRFMEMLIRKAQNVKEIPEFLTLMETQLEFLNMHMLNWVRLFGKKLKDSTEKESIYNYLSVFPALIIDLDKQGISELLEEFWIEETAE